MTDVSLNTVKQQIQGATSNPPPTFVNAENQGRAEAIELRGREQFLTLRGKWSGWLIIWISGLLIFHIALTILVGRQWLTFEKYQWFLPMVVVENFAQIVGMGIVIVRFLYPPSKMK